MRRSMLNFLLYRKRKDAISRAGNLKKSHVYFLLLLYSRKEEEEERKKECKWEVGKLGKKKELYRFENKR